MTFLHRLDLKNHGKGQCLISPGLSTVSGCKRRENSKAKKRKNLEVLASVSLKECQSAMIIRCQVMKIMPTNIWILTLFFVRLVLKLFPEHRGSELMVIIY